MDEFAELNLPEEEANAPEVSWQASEFEFHQKKAGWYLLFVIGFVALVATAYLTKQWMTIAVFAVMAAALMVYANRRPRDLQYRVDDHGVSIENKLYPFEHFASFAVIQNSEWNGIDLDPVKRFMPRISLPLEDEHDQDVVSALSARLPRIDREPDFIEKLTRRLKF